MHSAATSKGHHTDCLDCIGNIQRKQMNWIVNNRMKLSLLGVILIAILMAIIPSNTSMYLKNGNSVSLVKASFFRSFFPEANCKISYTPKTSSSATIVLWQSVFDGPILFISSTNSSALLCLYDYDVDLRLFKIDATKPYNPIKTNGELNRILFTSSCEIQEGMASDWQEVLSYLRTAQPHMYANQSASVWLRLNRNPSFY